MNIKDVINAIEKLESLNPKDKFSYKKAVLAYQSIKKLPICTIPILSKNEIFLFRSRIHEINIFFGKISDICHQEKVNVSSFGRCNIPGQSSFYCSENRETSFVELLSDFTDKNIGNKVYVTTGRWHLTRNFSAIVAISPDQEKRISKLHQLYGQQMDEFIENIADSDIREATIMLYRFLSEKFRTGQKDFKTYIITAAYYNLILSKCKANSVCYPSVPFGEQGLNFAIESEFINQENIELVDVMRSKISINAKENGLPLFVETEQISTQKIDKAQNNILW